MSANIKWFDDKNMQTTEVTVPSDLEGIGGRGYKSYDFPLTDILDIQVGESVITEARGLTLTDNTRTLTCVRGSYVIKKIAIEMVVPYIGQPQSLDPYLFCSSYIQENSESLTLYGFNNVRDVTDDRGASNTYCYATTIRWEITRIA